MLLLDVFFCLFQDAIVLQNFLNALDTQAGLIADMNLIVLQYMVKVVKIVSAHIKVLEDYGTLRQAKKIHPVIALLRYGAKNADKK